LRTRHLGTRRPDSRWRADCVVAQGRSPAVCGRAVWRQPAHRGHGHVVAHRHGAGSSRRHDGGRSRSL